QSLDVTGPLEVFHGAHRLTDARGRGERGYEVRTFSADGAPLRTSSGLTITPDARLRAAPQELDTLIVPGGGGARRAAADEQLLEWISAAAGRSRRAASVWTGALLR